MSLSDVYSAIHKATDLTVPGRSRISTGTIPVEQKSIHWLSMGAAGRNSLWGGIPEGSFLGTAGNEGTGGFVNSAVNTLFTLSDSKDQEKIFHFRSV